MPDARALVLRGSPSAPDVRVETIRLPGLEDGEVRIRVAASSLNYKDGLAVTGRGKIVRGEFPFVPGIDLAGTVEESRDGAVPVGTEVVLTGWGTGEARWGGFATHAVARADRLVALPGGLSAHDAMAFGTAGLTAMLAAMHLEREGIPDGTGDDPAQIVVTGASGGVGSYGVAILAALGHRVVASSGKAADFLADLGAAEVIGRDVLGGGAQRPLDRARWAGAIDTVGGPTLEALLSQMQPHATAAACGNAQGADLATTVFPFILRGVRLVGVDSNTAPMDDRRAAWARLATLIPASIRDRLTTTIALADVPAWADRIVRGEVEGRVVVDLTSA